MTRFDAIKIPLGEGVRLLLTPANEPAPESGMSSFPFLPAGWEGKLGSANSPILYDPGAAANGMHPLAIIEVAAFHWELQVVPTRHSSGLDLHSSLSDSTARNQWHKRTTSGRIHGDFRFTIYLGSAWFELLDKGQPCGHRLHFEVITEKIGYSQEYRAMVEAIGSRCSQLLLDWGAPTAINIASDPEKRSQTLLEQFLFLRHVLGPDRLDLYLETLSRHPHSSLNRERVWQPAALASPIAFARDPLRFGRHWKEVSDDPGMIDTFSAEEIVTERKYDCLDTPPNRFVKFALQTFRGVCEDVINSKITNPDTGRILVLKQDRGAAWQEAVQMRDALDAFLATAFFLEIGPLRRIPFESQALQKREGYREILHAWLMLEVAAQIDWPGRNDAYDGTNRDVATLYEFWLYFILIEMFQKGLGMTWLREERATADGPLPFCCRPTDGSMRINLKRGSESFCRFRWEHEGQRLIVHFFYNRQFREQPSILEDGSYSKGFRPDYTAVVISGEYEAMGWRKAEELAEAGGKISYLHFDAKYRIDTLKSLFGATEETDAERQETKSTGTVKNADLYKMHTYNEAIRRTVGSYVLYPGTDGRPNYSSTGTDRNIYRRYYEIIPGVGAFAIKPRVAGGNQEAEGLECLKGFFKDFLTHQISKFTQSHRINFWTHETVRESPSTYAFSANNLVLSKPPRDTQVLLGFVRDSGSAEDCRSNSVFFCHAIEWKSDLSRNDDGSGEPGRPTDLDYDPFRAEVFIAYSRNLSAPWLAIIKEVKLVTAKDRAEELDQPPTGMKAAYYYRIQLEKIHDTCSRDVSSLVYRRPGKPVLCSLAEFGLCAPVGPAGGDATAAK
jgi:predicted component of viral defense system (DUF524 family)